MCSSDLIVEEEEEIIITAEKKSEEKPKRRKTIFDRIIDKFGNMIEEGERDEN